MRVARYYSWNESKKEGTQEKEKEQVRNKEKVDSDRLTRSMTKKGVKFSECNFVKQQNSKEFWESRKKEEELKEKDIVMKYNFVEVVEEDEYLSHLVSYLVCFMRTQNITSFGLFYKKCGFYLEGV